MKQYRAVIFGIMMISIAIMLSVSVLSIGASPAKYDITYSPGNSYIYSFWVLNSEKQNITVETEVSGELKGFVEILNKTLDMKDTDQFQRVFFILKHPASINAPGSHTATFTFSQTNTIANRGEVKIIPSVETTLDLFVPYEGLVIEAGMNINSQNTNQPIQIAFPITNKGDQVINDIDISVDIIEGISNIVHKESLTSEKLKIGENKNIRKDITGIRPGEYQIQAKIDYDGMRLELNDSIVYGNWLLTFEDLRVPDFRVGKSTEVLFSLKNDWNVGLDDVYCDIEITDLHGYRYETISNVKPMAPYEEVQFRAYWVTNKTLQTGEYFFTAKIYYEDEVKKYSKKMTVEKDMVMTEYYTPTEKSKIDAFDPETIQRTVFFRMLIFSLIMLVIMGLFFYTLIQSIIIFKKFKRRKNAKEEKQIDEDITIAIQEKELGKLQEGGVPKDIETKQKGSEQGKIDDANDEETAERFRSRLKDIKAMFAASPISEKIASRRRIKDLMSKKKGIETAIVKAKNDLLILERAIRGLNKELQKMVITEAEFIKRMDILLEGKSQEYWERYYSKVLLDLENDLKIVNAQLWEEG